MVATNSVSSRRTFFKQSFLSALLIISYKEHLYGATTPLSTIEMLFRDFLHSKKPHTHPSYEEANPLFYINTILVNSRVDSQTKKFINDGAKWLNEEAVKKYKKIYTRLDFSAREALLKSVAKSGWGDRWLFMMLSFLLEAMLCDPIYGGNKNESGWAWLKHKSGEPRPKRVVS